MSRRKLLSNSIGEIPEMVFVIDTNFGDGEPTFRIPIGGPENFSTMTIDWGDGQESVAKNYEDVESMTHTFEEGGEYTIRIKSRHIFWVSSQSESDMDDSPKLLKVLKWGGIGGQFQFARSSNLTLDEVEDIPDLKYTDSLYLTFFRCYALESINRFNEWDLTKIKEFDRVFMFCNNFDMEIHQKIPNVETLRRAFFGCVSLNSTITFINCSRLTDLSNTFVDIHEMTYPIVLEGLPPLTVVSACFARAYKYNHPIDWDTSLVTNFSDFLLDAKEYNQPLNLDFSSGRSYSRFMSGKTSANYEPTYYDNILQRWDEGGQEDVKGVHMGSIKYTTVGEEYKNNLLSKGWTITDGGLNRPLILTYNTNLYTDAIIQLPGTGYDLKDIVVKDSLGVVVKSLVGITDDNIQITDLPVGIYDVEVSMPETSRMGFYSLSYERVNATLVEVKQWGDVIWDENLHSLFAYNNNLIITADDTMKISVVDVTNATMSGAFWGIAGITNMDWVEALPFYAMSNISELFIVANGIKDVVLDFNNASHLTNINSMFLSYQGMGEYESIIINNMGSTLTAMGDIILPYDTIPEGVSIPTLHTLIYNDLQISQNITGFTNGTAQAYVDFFDAIGDRSGKDQRTITMRVGDWNKLDAGQQAYVNQLLIDKNWAIAY